MKYIQVKHAALMTFLEVVGLNWKKTRLLEDLKGCVDVGTRNGELPCQASAAAVWSKVPNAMPARRGCMSVRGHPHKKAR